MNSVNEILNKMNIRLYSIRKPSILKNAGSESVRTDVFRSFPHFIFVGDDEINREWVFNLVGYLRYISYPCSWYGSQKKTYPGMNGSVRDHDVNEAPDSKQTETQDKTAKGIYVNEYENDLLICPVSVAEKHKDLVPDIRIYPGENGKRHLWSIIKKYVKEVAAVKFTRPSVNKANFILENPEKCLWIYNLAGYMDYNNMSYSWDESDAWEKSVRISFTPKNAERDVQIVGNTDDEQRRAVYKALMMKKYFEKDECGVIREGAFFKDDNN